jgi:hypothetical protein
MLHGLQKMNNLVCPGHFTYQPCFRVRLYLSVESSFMQASWIPWVQAWLLTIVLLYAYLAVPHVQDLILNQRYNYGYIMNTVWCQGADMRTKFCQVTDENLWFCRYIVPFMVVTVMCYILQASHSQCWTVDIVSLSQPSSPREGAILHELYLHMYTAFSTWYLP